MIKFIGTGHLDKAVSNTKYDRRNTKIALNAKRLYYNFNLSTKNLQDFLRSNKI